MQLAARGCQQSFNQGNHLRMCPITWPDHFANQEATFVDKKGLRHAKHVVKTYHPTLRIEQDGEGLPVGLHKGTNPTPEGADQGAAVNFFGLQTYYVRMVMMSIPLVSCMAGRDLPPCVSPGGEAR